MTIPKTQTVRCAIYTRVSTDQGLDQEFNSLDAQYEASKPRVHSVVVDFLFDSAAEEPGYFLKVHRVTLLDFR